jgi:outer membrane protein OmpA-like peptidoglycan-associated protein
MTRLARNHARSFAALLLLAGSSQTVACAKITTVSSESPISIQARPPAAPLAALASVPQPAPPARVVLDGDRLTIDEPLGFDAEAKLVLAEHEDILAEIAKWLAANPDVVELTIECPGSAEGSKRTQQKRSKALASQVVDALVAEGIAAERLVAASIPGSADPATQMQVSLRVSQRGEPDGASGFELED